MSSYFHFDQGGDLAMMSFFFFWATLNFLNGPFVLNLNVTVFFFKSSGVLIGHVIGENIVERLQSHLFGCFLELL